MHPLDYFLGTFLIYMAGAAVGFFLHLIGEAGMDLRLTPDAPDARAIFLWPIYVPLYMLLFINRGKRGIRKFPAWVLKGTLSGSKQLLKQFRNAKYAEELSTMKALGEMGDKKKPVAQQGLSNQASHQAQMQQIWQAYQALLARNQAAQQQPIAPPPWPQLGAPHNTKK